MVIGSGGSASSDMAAATLTTSGNQLGALIHAGGLRHPRDYLPQLAEHVGAVIYKRYRVYRKWLAGVALDQPGPAIIASKPA
jgi:hypothetical protein